MELARVEEGSREADATQAGGDCEVLFASAGPLLRAATEGPDLLHKSRGKRSARLAKRPDAAPTSGRGLERGGAGVTGPMGAGVSAGDDDVTWHAAVPADVEACTYGFWPL